jgi:hypothetical protein
MYQLSWISYEDELTEHVVEGPMAAIVELYELLTRSERVAEVTYRKKPE